ncbi:MAG: tape measure protein [Oscillospiraceae bacterium]|nr:tape measure protein [Oscillospiraceae bacterium]
MAVIRETLVLEDRFSAVFSSYLNLGRQIAANMRAATDAQSGFAAAAAESGAALGEMAGAGDRAAQSAEETAGAARKMSDSTSKAADHQNRMNRALRDGSSAANGLISRLKALAAAYVGLRSAQQLVNLSDTWTQTTARLDRMNDGRQTTPEAQDMIFHAAQRSRGDYQDTADMVSKLGTLAPDAFGSTAEVVAFAEQINKQFALAGTSAQGAQAAMLQLTQAMSSGVLRGEELNSVLEQAPTITQAIAKYMGVTIGELRELASEGQVTAQVVKAALFAAAEETNAAFEAVPLTFSQGWNMVKNEALSALRPALEQLSALLNSDIGRTAFNGLIAAAQLAGQAVSWLISLVEMGARWVMNNWETVSTVLIGLTVGIAAVMIASAAASAAAWIAANWPLILIVGSIALVIYMARQMGATWEEIGGIVGGVLYELYATGYNLTADAWNLVATFAEFFANVFNNPVAAIANLLADLGDWALGIIQSIASGIDAVFGSSLSSAVSGWRSNLKGWVHDTFGENEIKVQRMEHIDYGDAWNRGSEIGRSVGRAVDNFTLPDFLGNTGGTGFDYNALAAAANAGITPALEGIGGDTKAIRNSVALSEEDMKLLVDLAEREYITNVNLTAQTPIINVSGQNSGDTDMDRRLLADAIRDILIEQAASHTDLAYT